MFRVGEAVWVRMGNGSSSGVIKGTITEVLPEWPVRYRVRFSVIFNNLHESTVTADQLSGIADGR